MAYRLSGTYVGHCDCQQVCPCAMDGPPTGRDGQCHGLLVFGIREGNLDDTDLSGVNVAMGYMAPSNISSGNLKLGIVVDEAASMNRPTPWGVSSRATRVACSASSCR